LALLQAEASACVSELANVPNVCWLFFICGSAKQKSFNLALSFIFSSLAPNGHMYEMLGIAYSSLSAVTIADAVQKL